jgi:hypothetical protein
MHCNIYRIITYKISRNISVDINRYQHGKKFYLFSVILNCNSPSIHIVYRRHMETRMFSRNVGIQICIETALDLTKTNTSFTFLRWAKTSPAFTFSNRSRPELVLQSLAGYSVCTTDSFMGKNYVNLKLTTHFHLSSKHKKPLRCTSAIIRANGSTVEPSTVAQVTDNTQAC